MRLPLAYANSVDSFDPVVENFDPNSKHTRALWRVVKSMLHEEPTARISAENAKKQIEEIFGKPNVCNCVH